MNDVESVFEGLRQMTDGIVTLASRCAELVRLPPKTSEIQIKASLDGIIEAEENVDTLFERSATQIMDLEVFPVNPDYFLQIARDLDSMSDLIERTALLLEWRRELDEEETELLESAASQAEQLAGDVNACLRSLAHDRALVERLCGVIVEREKAVDQIRNHYNRISLKKGYEVEKRLWLTDVLGNLDSMADVARGLTITLRVIARKLEKQSRLDVKSGVFR